MEVTWKTLTELLSREFRNLRRIPVVSFGFAAAPVTDRRVRDYSRVLFAGASRETPDGQGRITISPLLRDYAGLVKDCTVIGTNTRIEIWNSDAWQSYLDSSEQAFADIAEEVLPGVL